MSSFTDVMSALAEQLDDLINPASSVPIHFHDGWFPIAETPNLDMRVLPATGFEEGRTGMGKHTRFGAWPLLLRVRVGMADSDAGQGLLYEMIDNDGPLSILAAIDSDRTLGGVVDSVDWGAGFPWSGLSPYLDANGDGSLAGSELTLIVQMTQS